MKFLTTILLLSSLSAMGSQKTMLMLNYDFSSFLDLDSDSIQKLAKASKQASIKRVKSNARFKKKSTVSKK